MPYANSGGVRIHYHLEGAGQPLILQHGFTGSLQGWHNNGYVEVLKHDYQLILIDARGHGASDKPHDPKAYDMQLRAADVVAVLDDLNIRQAHYLGYSMGGRMGFGLAKYAPARCHSLLIGGMHPYRWGQDILDQRANDLKRGMAAYVAAIETQGESLDPEYKSHLLASDPEALIASTLEYRIGQV
jgi:pimeloyl-ACP methyl ester carboxylesterase